ncbi:hypothetical protein HNP52_002220 [Sphingomonas kyeonggiensis]|uniref:Uncharacterized protein n=1 Tax=Sphingomonas kyeonggiensis TaxID=1268553 RepID=A0A7W7K1U5_9SPHN|nr:hypothetical protein [Sphingomonas kyeonggiensis]MBB4839151.1 hypothetical protein [Sphingomonas kyeonggiensis]
MAGKFEQSAAARANAALTAPNFRRNGVAGRVPARGRGQLHARRHRRGAGADIAPPPVDRLAGRHLHPLLVTERALQVRAATDAHGEFMLAVAKPPGHRGVFEQPAA